jgi:hypothetical protein
MMIGASWVACTVSLATCGAGLRECKFYTTIRLHRLCVNVGGEHLDMRHHVERLHVLAQEDGE